MKIRRSALDLVFSSCVRWRDSWTCRRCGVCYIDNPSGLHCAHVVAGRRHAATRWHPDNCLSLCAACHRWSAEHGYEFVAWLQDELPIPQLKRMVRLGRTVRRFRAQDRRDMLKYFRGCLSKFEQMDFPGELKPYD